MRVLVTGAGGQLGAAVVQECAVAHEVVAVAHRDLDIGQDDAVADAVKRARPNAIVNCAAYNDVDRAEEQPVVALTVNAFAVRALAREAERAGAMFVHYGSDFVFDGRQSEPYTEDVPPSPLSVYGASKMLGEWFALDPPRAYVLRVESLFGRVPGGPPSKGSVASIANGLLAGSSPRVFSDRTVSPSYVVDLARATRAILERQPAPGLYHCVNSGACTWEAFALELARRMGVEPKVTPVRVADVSLRARRPQYCALSNEKLRRAGIEMPTWQDAVARFVDAGVA